MSSIQDGTLSVNAQEADIEKWVSCFGIHVGHNVFRLTPPGYLSILPKEWRRGRVVEIRSSEVLTLFGREMDFKPRLCSFGYLLDTFLLLDVVKWMDQQFATWIAWPIRYVKASGGDQDSYVDLAYALVPIDQNQLASCVRPFARRVIFRKVWKESDKRKVEIRGAGGSFEGLKEVFRVIGDIVDLIVRRLKIWMTKAVTSVGNLFDVMENRRKVRSKMMELEMDTRLSRLSEIPVADISPERLEEFFKEI